MAKHKDPYQDREALKYPRPIPSRELIMQVLGELGRPQTIIKLAKELELFDEENLEALRRRLKAMEREGQLIRNRRQGYGLVTKMDLVRGRVTGHPDGYGFLIPDQGGPDLFLSTREMRTVMHGDHAVARVAGIDRRGRSEGAIVEVLERNNLQLVGHLHVEGGIAFVVPENRRISQDILIPNEEHGGAVDGQIVVVEIIQQPDRHRQTVGRIVEVLGDHMAPGMEIDIAIRDHHLPQQWPPQVRAETQGFDPQHIPASARQGRQDLRTLPLVTIDGEDAQDFDDAVYCTRHDSGWRLLVAIADVSFYVKPGSPLDEAALERGNSVYFPGRVIPMLPEVLSNGLCSLNPGVDRLCLVCEMFITPSGKVERYQFFTAVMCSQARLTYKQVAAMLDDKDNTLYPEQRELLPHLQQLYELYKTLRVQREERGAIDFDTTETRIVFGPNKKIERIVPLQRNDAHRMIEEFMIAANVCAAKFLLASKLPTLLRVHEGPKSEKLTDLRSFIAELGLRLEGGDKPEPRHYARLIKSIEERPDRHLVETVLLRSLSQAQYSPDHAGHFGLAFTEYTHFTSPIRRYPDLLVHRTITHLLSGKHSADAPYSYTDMQSLGKHCSTTERRADEATRDVVDWLKCEYMMDKVGEEFAGIISTVTGFGLFVELNEIYVEGLVHVTELRNDYYHFDPVKHHLRGERTNTVYRLADKIKVRLARVDMEQRKIDFVLQERPDQKTGRKKHKGKRKKG